MMVTVRLKADTTCVRLKADHCVRLKAWPHYMPGLGVVDSLIRDRLGDSLGLLLHLLQPSPRPRELETEDAEANRDHDERRARQHHHGDADRQHGEADNRDGDASGEAIRDVGHGGWGGRWRLLS